MLCDVDRFPSPSLPALHSWLFTRAIPLWLRHGIDRNAGAFQESIAPSTYACTGDFRRLRVAARQIVVFSRAYIAGVQGAAEAVRLGIDFLANHAALPEGGYAWRFDLANSPIDTTRDLYDHAFVLLALAEAAAVLPTIPLRRQALALMGFLDCHMTHPICGWVESIPARLPRRQNPHMHLLEAMLAAHRAFGDPIFLDRAGTLVDLFLTRLLDPETGALPESFDDMLRPRRHGGVFLIEPGHHCEWAWLLHAYARLVGTDARLDVTARHLLDFLGSGAMHPRTGDLIDQLASTGEPYRISARLWPQTERLKTAFLYNRESRDGLTQALTSVAAYLRPDGTWHERRAADGSFVPGDSPATSLYHLTTGILTAAASI